MILKRPNAIIDKTINIYEDPEKKSTDVTDIHVPKNSSITTALGSSPQYFSITLSVQTPIINEPTTREIAAMNSHIGDRM